MMKMIKMIINPASIRNEAQPVLKLYYHQAQSSQHPKRGTGSTKLVLQSSTIQPASTKLVLQSARLPLVSQTSRFRMGNRESRNLPDCPRSPKNLDSCWGNDPKTPPEIEPANSSVQVYEATCFSTELWPPMPNFTFAKSI